MYNDTHPSLYIVSYRVFSLTRIFCALAVCLCPYSILGNHWSFQCFHSFFFSRMSCNWNHIVCSLFRFVSFTEKHLKFLHIFSWLDSSFYCIAELFSIITFTTVIHSLTQGCLGCFQVLAVVNKAGIKSACRISWDISSSALLDKCQEVRLLDCMVKLCLALWKNTKLSSEVAAPFCIPSNHEREFMLLWVPQHLVLSVF